MSDQMRARKMSVRTVCIGTLVAAVALVGGFALGTFAISSFLTSPPQSSARESPTVPTGVSYPLVQSNTIGGNTVPKTGQCKVADSSTGAAPDALVAGSTIPICLTGVAGTGYQGGETMQIWQINWGTTASVSQAYDISVSIIVVPSANSMTTDVYVKTPAALASAAVANLAIDLTAASDTSVSGYNIIVTQCSGATCP